MKQLYIVALMFCLTFHTTAQDNTMFFMDRIPQTMHINPAVQHPCLVWVNAPIPTLQFNFANTGFGLNNLYRKLRSDSLLIDITQIENSLKDRNYIHTNLDFDLLSFGFNVEKIKTYFRFSLSYKVDSYIGFSKNLIAIRSGNWDVENWKPIERDFSGIQVNLNSYTEIMVGASHKLNDNLKLGANLKYLNGGVAVRTSESTIKWKTANNQEMFRHTYEVDYKLNISAPIEIELDSAGNVDDVTADDADKNIVENYVFTKNHGFAIDLGAIYEMKDWKTTFYASIVDLGFIGWNQNLNNMFVNNTFDYSGIDMTDMLFDTTQVDEPILDNLADSISEAFKPQYAQSSFTTYLPTKIFLGATYNLNEKINFGILNQTIIYDKRLHPQLTLSVNTNFAKWFTATASYSMMNNSFLNFGFGLGFKVPGVQWFIVSDNIPSQFIQTNDGIILPYRSRTFNLRMGLNLIFGCKKKTSQSLIN